MITHLEINGSHFYNVTAEDLKNAGIEQGLIDAVYSEEKWANIRAKRDSLISDTDKEYLRHNRELRNGKIVDGESNSTTLSGKQLSELDAYVQMLADIPQTYNNPDDVIWPEKPVL